ncbi:MAG: hypothetical protein QJR08_04345 [Bacillota bacterium]|nr:hypothetical protein [Bacillota bacterium]
MATRRKTSNLTSPDTQLGALRGYKTSQGYTTTRVGDMSGGLNTEVPPDLLNDNESPVSLNVDRRLKGIARPAMGRRARYSAPFDTSGGVRGVGVYAKKDGRSWLLAGVGAKLYADQPHLTVIYDAQADWQRGTVTGSVSTTASAGDVTLQGQTVSETANADFTQGSGDANIDLGTAGHVKLKLSGSTYLSPGTWTSPVIDLGIDSASVGPVTVSWTVTLPSGTTLTVNARTSADGSTWSAWQSLPSSGAAVTNPQRYLELQFVLTSTGANTPDLTAISVSVNETWTGTWTSDTINVSQATNQESGIVAPNQDTSMGGSIAWFSRSSADGTTWSAWYAVNADGSMAHPANPYVQVQAKITTDASRASPPVIHAVTLTWDGAPAMTALSGVTWTSGGWFRFATLNDLLIIVNGIDAPAKYDGTTLALLGGSPPSGARYAAVHQNRLWLAGSVSNPSRVWFSDPLNPESWPTLNFIDVSPDDGDQITGIIPYSNTLVVFKQRSTWAITGDSVDNFALVRVHEGIGCVAPASPVIVDLASKLYLAWVSDQGLYFSDLNQPVLATRRIQPDWLGLNMRRINTAACGFFQDALYISVPGYSAQVPDRTYVFDSLRQCFDLRPNWAISGYAIFREAGKQKIILADANVGQLYETDAATDLGAAVGFEIETKAFDFGAAERVKRIRRVLIEARANGADGQLQLQFRPDLGALSSPITVTVPNDGEVHTLIVYPSQVGVIQAHTLGVHIKELAAGARTEIHSIAVEYMVRQARAS